MKINIAFLAPEKGIGGGNRKYEIYFKYLNPKYFSKYYIYLNKNGNAQIKRGNKIYSVGQNRLFDFLNSKKIDFFYPGIVIDKKVYNRIKDNVCIIKNVSFTHSYSKEKNELNFIISKTDYVKQKMIQKKLKNSYVVYNPIDVKLWKDIKKSCKGKYRNFFKRKKVKFIVGRIARAEPSKWNFLILKTLLTLKNKKNFNYGFIFVGMPLLYRNFINLFLGKKMKNRILLLPEMKNVKDLGEVYSSMDLFWQTSKIGESFGNVIAEAFCFKVPVITDYKGFAKKWGKVNKKKYDAQIELVDNKVNGAYCNFPSTVINFLNSNNCKKLEKMGSKGFKKVEKNYDALIAGNTIAKILYDIKKSKSITKSDKKFEIIKKIPSEKEIEEYEKEYFLRLNSAISENKIGALSELSYKIQEKIWHLAEWNYLILRKMLRFLKIEIESF